MKSVIVFDPDKCCACSACAVACMDQNDIDVQAREESYRRTFDLELDEDGGLYCAYLSSACNHCADAPCIAACPVGCIKKDPKTGMTIYDNHNCIGCKSCAMACPFGVPRYRPSDGKMVKCDGCYLRLQNGLKPACVRACSFGALECMTERQFSEKSGEKAAGALVRTLRIME